MLGLASCIGARWVLKPANGVDHQVFSPGKGSPSEHRAALGFDPTMPLMLFVGRFVAIKRLNLVRQMAAARPDWQWCVVGQGPEQPATWGLPNVRVLPPMPQLQLAAYYRGADLLVLPSASEGFPLVVQEAMACGLPVCITALVAAGSVMPDGLWLELPERPDRPRETAQRGAEAIDAWLASPEAHRRDQRADCARFAAGHWRWDAAARAHTRWLHGEPG